jgi:C1A family cysteine protease
LFVCFSTYREGEGGGCFGGDQYHVYGKVMEMGGITTEKLYPYNVADNKANSPCDRTKTNYVATVIKINRILTEQEMIDYVLTTGTLSVDVSGSGWKSYVSGIYSSCPSGSKIDHAVNIVGVNVVERYSIVRNSWGRRWGEDGWMKLAMVSECAAATHIVSISISLNNHFVCYPPLSPSYST